MLRLTPLLLFLGTTAALAAPPRPTSASLRKSFEANAERVIKVQGPKKGGPGVLVSKDGHVVTSVDYVSLEKATLKLNGSEVPAEVVFADARLKVAVVRPLSGEFHAAPVELQKTLAAGDWLLAISPKKGGGAEPKVGQVLRAANEKTPFIETDLFFPPGTPLFDAKGRLLAVLVTAKGRALPLPVIKAKLSEQQQLKVSEDRP